MSLITLIQTRRRHIQPVFYALLASSLFVSVAKATCTTSCNIEVNFVGIYSDETCNIVINGATNTEVVSLPQLSVASLQNNGTEAGSVPFKITLKDCPASRKVTLFFNSSSTAADSETGNLVNSTGDDYSSNVQIRLRKENNEQTIIDSSESGQEYSIPAEAGDVEHIFTASYYAKGSSAVTAGKVHAIAGVELVYQ